MMLDVEGDYLDILYIYIFMDKYINVIYITYHKWTMIFFILGFSSHHNVCYMVHIIYILYSSY